MLNCMVLVCKGKGKGAFCRLSALQGRHAVWQWHTGSVPLPCVALVGEGARVVAAGRLQSAMATITTPPVGVWGAWGALCSPQGQVLAWASADGGWHEAMGMAILAHFAAPPAEEEPRCGTQNAPDASPLSAPKTAKEASAVAAVDKEVATQEAAAPDTGAAVQATENAAERTAARTAGREEADEGTDSPTDNGAVTTEAQVCPAVPDAAEGENVPSAVRDAQVAGNEERELSVKSPSSAAPTAIAAIAAQDDARGDTLDQAAPLDKADATNVSAPTDDGKAGEDEAPQEAMSALVEADNKNDLQEEDEVYAVDDYYLPEDKDPRPVPPQYALYFRAFPPCPALQEALPGSRFITVHQQDVVYVLGVLYNSEGAPTHLCYGVPGVRDCPLRDGEWVPTDDNGYWLIYTALG